MFQPFTSSLCTVLHALIKGGEYQPTGEGGVAWQNRGFPDGSSALGLRITLPPRLIDVNVCKRNCQTPSGIYGLKLTHQRACFNARVSLATIYLARF